MPMTALCRFTSVLRTLAADRGLDTMLSQVALQGILFKYTNKSNKSNIYNKYYKCLTNVTAVLQGILFKNTKLVIKYAYK